MGQLKTGYLFRMVMKFKNILLNLHNTYLRLLNLLATLALFIMLLLLLLRLAWLLQLRMLNQTNLLPLRQDLRDRYTSVRSSNFPFLSFQIKI